MAGLLPLPMWRAPVRRGTGLFLTLVAGACGAGNAEPDDLATFSRKDSAGILVAVSPGLRATTPIGWEVDSVPEVVIGATDSDFLHRVQGVASLPDGGVLVVAGGSQELRWFDSRGQLRQRVGGDGEGPGEFRDPVLVPWVGGDSLLVFDKRVPRLQVLSSDGRYQRSIRYRGWPNGRRAAIGALGPDALLFEGGGFVGGEASLRGGGLHQAINEYFWYDAETAARSVADSVVYDWAYGTGGVLVGIPFTSYPAAVVGPHGVLVTDGRTPEIREYDRDARLRRILRVMQHPRPVTAAMIASLPSGAAKEGVPIPNSLSVFRALVTDSDGWVWAEVYDWDATRPKEWVVFDQEGEAHGTVRTPAGFEIKAIERDHMWGIWRDDFRVEYVRRHSLRRRAKRW